MRISLSVIVAAVALLANTLDAQNTLVECQLRLTATDTYTGRCVRHDTSVAMIALHPATRPQAGRWRGINARVFGRGGDSADVVDWSAFSPAIVDVGTANGIFSSWLGWFRVRQAVFDTAGLRFSADA